jgi:hypothetical protein
MDINFGAGSGALAIPFSFKVARELQTLFKFSQKLSNNKISWIVGLSSLPALTSAIYNFYSSFSVRVRDNVQLCIDICIMKK